MKIFLENYNGVLDLIEDTLDERGELTDNPHEADLFLLWQDVRGVPKQVANLAKEQLGKPVIVMQHGRGATRDYCAPNKFPLLADRILVWGEREKERLRGIGVAEDRISVVGCPLFPRLKTRAEHQGRNVLFVPVISSKEEPENILVYAALKKWESEKLIDTVSTQFNQMKRAWAWENTEFKEFINPDGSKDRRLWKRDVKPILPRWVTYAAGLINVKLAGIHDMYQYQAPLINTPQNDPNLIDGLVDLLKNVDVMVCLEEGTMQLLACMMGIPVIVVDIFKYENYGGCANYDQVEKIKTNACHWINNIGKVGTTLDHVFRNPSELARHRAQVCEDEGGSHLGNATDNILKIIEGYRNAKQLVTC